MRRSASTLLAAALSIISLTVGAGSAEATPVVSQCEAVRSAWPIESTAVDAIEGCAGIDGVLIRDAESNITVALPPEGIAVTYSALSDTPGIDIPEFTVARSRNGEIATASVTPNRRVVEGSMTTARAFGLTSDATADSAVQATNPKCDSFAYSISNERWLSTASWYYRAPSFGGQVRVAAAFSAMADGIGDCGTNTPNSAAHSYAGSTTSSSQVNDSICGPSDLKNVVDGGDLSGTTLAATCTWRTTGQIVNADIRIDTSSRSWYTGSSTTGCSGSSTYDLQGVMTHEAGHFFGLNHVAQSTNQVMVPSSFACQTSHRRLGNGDLAGMKARYP